VIHDNEDLRLVYDVIRLAEPEAPNAIRINRERSKHAVEKYRDILINLSKGGPPSTKDEKRVAALFGPGAKKSEFKRASDRVRCQMGLRDRFQKSIVRSGAYIDEIKRIFRSHSLPEDLAYLPHVESSFNPRAYSKAGAAGIWQFTLSTGKKFMEVGYTVDERWDPIRSSRAAARFLKESYEILGHWPLALTAYNHGVSGMIRAKKAKGGYEDIFREYRSRSFRFASRNFYSEFLAACEVAKNYRDYFGELKVERPFKGREMVLEGFVPLMDLADYLKIDPSLIRSLNPSLRDPVYRGEKHIPKGYALRLPVKVWEEAGLSSHDLPKRLHRPEQKRTRFYRVMPGDTVGEIARTHGVQVRELILANNLNSRALIYAGQNLRIPAKDETLFRTAMTSSPGPGAVEPDLSGPKPEKTKPPLKESSGKGSSEIKALTAVSVPDIKGSAVNPAIVTGDFLVEKVLSHNGIRVGIIRVEVEETLGHYADWLGISTGEIRRLNGFSYRKIIRVNDRIKIPLKKVTKEAFEEKRFEYHKEIQDDFFASYRVKDIEVYQVKNGDNIWTLCQDVFEVPFWLIYKYNSQLDFSQLNPSQKLVVPLIEEIG